MDYLPYYINSITIGLLTIILILFFYLSKRSKVPIYKANLAPQAKGAWPILGHLPLLGSSKLPHVTLGALADKYGPIFTIRLGVFPSLVISNSEIAKECFTTNDLGVSSRPRLVFMEHIGYNHAMFGFGPPGPYWREMRKIATLELLSTRRLEQLKHTRASEVSTFLKELYETWSTKGTCKEEVIVELKQWFGDMTLNVILRMVVGKRYFVAANEEDKKEARRVQKALREFIRYVGSFVVGDAVPYLKWLDLGGQEKAMKKTGKELDTIIGGWLEEHKERRKKLGDGDVKGEQDFMDSMISVLDGCGLAGFDADTIIKATSMNMITGGRDSIWVTLTWAISLLLNNLHVLRRAQNELDTKIGRQRVVSESDINNLVYIQAIVKETLRLYPAASLSVPREFTCDCTIAGYHVSKGTRLITNLWKIQTDPKIWPEPFEFKPERFLTTHKDVDVRGHHFELIPFGNGRRACPGLVFGLQMVQFTLASFLHAFEISSPSNAPIDMSENFGLTNIKATPLEVLIKPRLASQLYV